MAIITLARATELVPNFSSADNLVMTDIVNACSSLVETYCNRTFSVQSYDELFDGTGHRNLLLDHYPVTQIDRVLFNRTAVISIGNLKSTVSRASFRLDSTNLYLTAVDDGTVINRTIPLSGCTKFSDLASAVSAYSSEGWAATALGIYANWLTADLYAPQGGQEVRWVGYGYIWHHTFGVPANMQNPAVGEIVSPFWFERGYQNYRVQYSAGFDVVPFEIQQATAELSAAVYLNREVNPNLAAENLGSYSYTNLAEKTFANLSIASRYALSQYRSIRIAKFRVC